MATEGNSTSLAPFQMPGARRILEVSPTATGIERLVEAVERAVVEDPWQVFDLSKSLIETVCKTILEDRGQTPDSKMNCQQLVAATAGVIPLAPTDHTDKAAIQDSSRKMIGGMNSMIQGLCEIRNRESSASHGRDAYMDGLGQLHAEGVARTTDSLISFLYLAHKETSKSSPGHRIHFEDHTDFNEHIDDLNEMIRIFDLKYRPSDVLFRLDIEAYRDKHEMYMIAVADEEANDESVGEPGGDS